MSFISSKWVITRKEHECFTCGKICPAKSKMNCTVETHEYEYKIMSNYFCEICQCYIDQLTDASDGFMQYELCGVPEYIEFAEKFINDKQHES